MAVCAARDRCAGGWRRGNIRAAAAVLLGSGKPLSDEAAAYFPGGYFIRRGAMGSDSGSKRPVSGAGYVDADSNYEPVSALSPRDQRRICRKRPLPV